MENVTEELVRQNGNQAAAVMADYAGQGGGGGEGGGGSLPDYLTPYAELQWRELTEADEAKFPTDLADLDKAVEVADLPDGKIPLIGYTAYVGFPEYDGNTGTNFEVLHIKSINPIGESGEHYCYEVGFVGAMSGEWGILTADRTLLFRMFEVEVVG